MRHSNGSKDLVLHAPLEKVQGRIFNVGSGVDRTVLSIAQDILRLMGVSQENISLVGDRPGQVFRHTADTTLLSQTLGWKMKISWEEGLERTIAWYTKNPSWWQKQVWMRKIPIILADGRREMH